MAFYEEFLDTFRESHREFQLPIAPIGNCCAWSESQNGFLFSCAEGIFAANSRDVRLTCLRPGSLSTSIQINHTGSLLLETHEKTILITRLTQRKPTTTSFNFTSPILRALWHPASPSHFCVLLENRLILLRFTPDGIQRVSFFPLPMEDVVDFCFGHPDLQGWGRFSVLFLGLQGKLHILTPVVPMNCMLSENEYGELESQLLFSQDHRQMDKLRFWLQDNFTQQTSLQGKIYYEYKNPEERIAEFFSPKIVNEGLAGAITWSRIIVLDPNVGSGENGTTLTALRVSTQGQIEILSSFYPLIPAADVFRHFVILDSASIDIPEVPVHIVQHNQVAFVVTQQTVHYVDFTSLAGLPQLLKEERDPSSFLETFKLRTKCLRFCPKPVILGVEFLVHTTMGSGLLVFEVPNNVQLLQVEDILDPLEIPAMLALKNVERFPDFDAEGKLNLLLSRVRKIFDQPKLKDVKLDDKAQCEAFIADIRNEICQVHEELYEVSQEIMGRMSLIERLESQVIDQRDQHLKLMEVAKENMKRNRELVKQYKEQSVNLLAMAERCRDCAMNQMPKYSRRELQFKDLVDTAKRKTSAIIDRHSNLKEELQEFGHLQPPRACIDAASYTPVLHEQQRIIKALKNRVLSIQTLV